MVTPALTRLPWRILGRQRMINTPLTKTTQAQLQDRVSSRRQLSDSANPPLAPEISEHVSVGPKYTPAPGHLDPNDEVDVRLPRAVQAVYLKPLRRQAQYGIPSCDLQMRSYNVRNLEFFADFALRAAYYLGLPASGPVPLPRIVERWTVPRSHFVNKKSQENFERKTLRRLIQIKDGHPETVQVWLSFLKEHAYYGIGMKANVWNWEKLGVGKTMDAQMEELKKDLDTKWSLMGLNNRTAPEKVVELVDKKTFQSGRQGPKTKDDPLRMNRRTFS